MREGRAQWCQPCGCEVECPVGLVCVCVAADASSGIVLNLREYSCRCSGGRVSRGEAKSSFNEFSRGEPGTLRTSCVKTFSENHVFIIIIIINFCSGVSLNDFDVETLYLTLRADSCVPCVPLLPRASRRWSTLCPSCRRRASAWPTNPGRRSTLTPRDPTVGNSRARRRTHSAGRTRR